MNKLSRNSYLSVAVPVTEAAPAQPTSREEMRVALEAELRAATREHEAELLANFDRLPKWNTNEGGQVRRRYWNGEQWIEFDLDDPPLWAVENIDPDSLAPPGICGE
jgi:hypothetical protein